MPKLSGRGDATNGTTQLAEKLVLGNDLFGGLDGGGLFIAHCCSSGWLVSCLTKLFGEGLSSMKLLEMTIDVLLLLLCCSGHVFFFVCVLCF